MQNNKYLIVTHNRVYGIPDALRDYLNEKKKKLVVFIAHPLDKIDGDSFMQVYIKGKKVDESRIKRNKSLGSINFIIDALITIYWVVFKLPKFDILIGNDNLNASSGILLKLFGRTKKTIFYAMDFSKDRLGNKLLNKIYHSLEKMSVWYSDEIWVVSVGITYAREKYLGIDSNKYPQKIVPTGVWINKKNAKSIDKINKHQLFFIGHLLEKQGLQEVIRSIPKITKKIKDFKFVIVGDGEYKKSLEQLAAQLKVTKYIKFTGVIQNHDNVFEIMSSSSVGIAPYVPSRDKSENFTYYGDPGKIKDYLSAGLPVIMTDVSHNSRSLQKRGCAIVVKYDLDEFAKAVIKIMTNLKTLDTYRRNATLVSKEFDWHSIFDKAFTNVASFD